MESYKLRILNVFVLLNRASRVTIKKRLKFQFTCNLL